MARQVETTYGDALLELALEEGSLDMLYEEAQALVTVLQENEELLRILRHPQIDKDEKRKIVDNIFKGRVSKDMVGLFGIMVEKDHGSKIVDVLHYFIRQVKRVKNIGVASVTSAEESTAWPMMTHPVEAGGLGFDYKWNMGWMNDFLNYMKLDPLYRKYHHNDLTFSMVYAYSEKFILVLSHDEVVHEKGSMIAKMPGGYEDKFSNLRVAYGYMMTHPGKKLLFMGQEIAQFAEFNENAEVDWSLFEFDAHVFMQGYVKELNELYKTEPALYELDSSPEGFTWINCNSANTSLLSYVRKGKKESDTLLIICNFTPMEHKAYKLATPSGGRWQEIFSSDNSRYGGEGRNNKTVKQAKKAECDGQNHYISVNVPPLSISVFKKKIGK